MLVKMVLGNQYAIVQIVLLNVIQISLSAEGPNRLNQI